MDFLRFAATIADGAHKPAANPAKHADADPRAYSEQAKKVVPADVRMFSGCQDSQTSADVTNVASFGLPETSGPAGAGGACTNSLIKALHDNHHPTWIELLGAMRTILKTKGYSQIPELSASRQFDLNSPFKIVEGSGKKKALMIGINYVGMKGELRGCHNDVDIMKKFIQYLGFSDIKILMDKEGYESPTQSNIMHAMHWLVEDAESGDSLFMHYSGHGGQVPDEDGDEADGLDETMVPLDYQSAGQIRDDDIFKALVAPLPAGVRLTAVMDCCHSGTILDLPYVIKADDQTFATVEAGGTPALHANPDFNIEKLIKVATACFKAYQSSGGDIKQVGMAAFRELSGGGGSGGGGGGLAKLGGFKFW